MRTRTYGVVAILALAVGGFLALSLTRGQERGRPAPVMQERVPASATPPPAPTLAAPPDDRKEILRRAALGGADWLTRMNRVDGTFVHAHLPATGTLIQRDPAVKQPGGTYYTDLRQLVAAFALARAARFTKDPRQAARATQAVVRCLEDTATDATAPSVRYPTAPSTAVNRLAAAGLLLLAIHELPSAPPDLLDKSDQLCEFIRRRQQLDGSFKCNDGLGSTPAVAADDQAYYSGIAIYGVLHSQPKRPAAWKHEFARKLLAHLQPGWRARKGAFALPWLVAAFSEAYLQTRDRPFANAVFELNDWLCELQYRKLDAEHPDWWGGFMACADGKAVKSVPDARSALYALALVEGCRVARQAADVRHYDRYRAAAELCLQFVVRLQYNEANTQHFAPWYRRDFLLGAFHASTQDGNLRLDHTADAVAALVQCLTCVD